MPQPIQQTNPRYREVKVLRDQDGVICVVTERIDSNQPYHSYSFQKEYEKDGRTYRTGYLSRRHTAAIRRLLTQLEEFLDGEVEKNYARAWQDERRAGSGR